MPVLETAQGEEDEQVGVISSDNNGSNVGMKETESPENCACSGIFFPLGVNDGNISQALWHFHFHNCVISRNFSHLRKLSWKHERLRGRNGERGRPLALLHPPPHPCCLCFTFPSYLLSFCSGYLHFSLSPPSSVFEQH